jgi:hypothetical protein
VCTRVVYLGTGERIVTGLKRLNLAEGEKTVFAGDASGQFEPAQPFTFLGVS